MNWVKLCLRNRLIIYVISFVICLIGLYALLQRPISPFPQIDMPAFNILINYPGANAQTVQKQITNEVVPQLRSLENVDYINAYTQAGAVNMVVMLNKSDPLAALRAQVQIIQAISSAHLPSSVPQPRIMMQAGSSGLVTYVLSSSQFNIFYLNNFIAANLEPEFSSYPGVRVDHDNFDPAVKIQLIPELLVKYHLTPSAIVNTINQNYQSAPLGSLNIKQQTYLLNTVDDYNSLNALEQLIVGYYDTNNQLGTPVRLKDIATIRFAPRDEFSNSYVSFNGKTAASFTLYTRTQANPFVTSSKASHYIKTLAATLPGDLHITPVFNMADVMHTSISEVVLTMIIASLLVLLVALVFLGRLQTTLIPIIAIPVCLLGAVMSFVLFGFSINILTLLAMVIAVGLVVDDAIVVVENITRYIEQGHDKYNAILLGTSSIIKTIIGITLTLVAVYLPMMFIDGFVAILLQDFALTLAAAVLVSGVVAITLTPVLALHLISDRPENRYQQWFDRVLHRIIDGYQWILKIIFKQPVSFLILIIALIIAASHFALQLPKEVFPVDPNGSIKITITGTASDSLQDLKQKTTEFKQFYTSKAVKYYYIGISPDNTTGIQTAKIEIQYQPQYLTKLPSYANSMMAYIKQHKIENTVAQVEKFMNAGDDSYDIGFYIYGAADQKAINIAAKKITNTLKALPDFSAVSNTISQPQKQLAFDINTVKAQHLGISREQILQLLSTLYGGAQMNNNFSIAGLSVPIVVQLNTKNLTDPNSYQKLMITSDLTQKRYPLSDFITLKTVANPEMIVTYNGDSAVKIQAKLAQGYDMAKGMQAIDHLLQQQYSQVQYAYVDNAKQYQQDKNQSILIAIFGVIAVYLLLTILFKSLLDPFIIMLTAPFTVLGGALSLYLIDGSINIFSTLGLITLVGLITKHGVLIVQFANTELHNGAKALEAIMQATRYRFRPIIMTTLAMVFGALPLLISHDILYVSRQNLAITLVGGLLIGTLFSLFIVPLVYYLFKRKA